MIKAEARRIQDLRLKVEVRRTLLSVARDRGHVSLVARSRSSNALHRINGRASDCDRLAQR